VDPRTECPVAGRDQHSEPGHHRITAAGVRQRPECADRRNGHWQIDHHRCHEPAARREGFQRPGPHGQRSGGGRGGVRAERGLARCTPRHAAGIRSGGGWRGVDRAARGQRGRPQRQPGERARRAADGLGGDHAPPGGHPRAGGAPVAHAGAAAHRLPGSLRTTGARARGVCRAGGAHWPGAPGTPPACRGGT